MRNLIKKDLSKICFLTAIFFTAVSFFVGIIFGYFSISVTVKKVCIIFCLSVFIYFFMLSVYICIYLLKINANIHKKEKIDKVA